MKHTRLISTLLLTAIFSVSVGGCAGCKGCNVNETAPLITPTTTVTATIAPVTDNINTPVPTDEVVSTATPAITEEVSPTEEVTPTEAVVPTPEPSPVPTATPEPTATPTPVITVDEDATLLGSAKMGDNVWYDFYDDGTLVVRGTGATYDFKDYSDMQLTVRKQTDFLKDESLYNVVKTIIIKEGITEIGTSALDTMGLAEKVVFPTSLKKIGDMALSGVGYFTNIEWIGLDVDKVEISKTAFSYCGNAHKVTGLSKYTATPTPTPIPPTPTPTPLPNPDKPRLVRTETMGKNVIYELWDNGYLYIKGSGPIEDKRMGFIRYDECYYYDEEWYVRNGMTLSDRKRYWEDDYLTKEFCNSIKYVIIDEGITELGSYTLNQLDSISFYQLPSTLDPSTLYTGAGEYIEMFQCGSHSIAEIHGWWEGRKFVLYDVYPDSVFGSMWNSCREKRPQGSTFLEMYGDQIIWE